MPRTYQMQSTSASSSAGPADPAEVGPQLAVVEAVAEQPAVGSAGSARAGPIQTRMPSRWPASASVGEQLGVLLAAPQQVVGRDQPVRGAGQAAVAVEAGADEGLVGQVVAGEQRRDPLEERRLRERAGGREQAEDRPLDAVGERRRGRVAVRRGRRATSGRARSRRAARCVGPADLVADERQQPVDRVGDGARRPWPRRSDPRRASGGAPAARSATAAGPRSVGAASRAGRRPAGSRRPPGRPPSGPIAVDGSHPSARPRVRARVRGGEAAELAGPVEADEDLAEEPLVAGGLAAGAQRLDRGVGHGPGRLGRRERPLVEALRRRRTGRGPGPGPGRRRRPGRRQRDVGARPRARAAATEPGGTNSTTPPISSSPSASRALTSR